MVDKDIPASIISIIYPFSQTKVRFHRATTDELWVVGADICNILGLTNISYVSKKLPRTYKHKIETKGGKQVVLWFPLESVYTLCREHNAMDLINWLRMTALQLPSEFKRSSYVFEEPVIIERRTLSKMLDVMEELRLQNVI